MRTGRLIAALLLIPVADALLLAVVATRIGVVGTVAVVVLTALVGTLLVRAEGRHALRKMRRSLAEGRQPTDQLVDGGLLLVAGAFLLTPGVVTDAVGFLLALPPTRIPVRALVKRRLGAKLDERTGGFVSGDVYTFGFPDGEADEETGGATTVEFDDVSDRDGSNENA
jgi:UPF0716 protein FxsA